MPPKPIETPSSIRETFLPDEGCVFVRIDESQIEDRMGKMYCGSKRMVELANLPPWEYDAHTENANAIFEQDIRKLPKAEYKRYRYLGKKCVHACVDEQTEILTSKGFVPFAFLSKQDKIAQWDKETKEIFFREPNEIYRYEYTGDLYHFGSNALDFLVTPNHRIGYYTRAKNNFKVKTAEELSKLHGFTVPCAGFYSGKLNLPKAFTKLLVAAQADSSFRDGYYLWRFKKIRKVERLCRLLTQASFTYKRRELRNGIVAVSISVWDSKRISYYLKDGKSFSLETLLTFNQRTLETFVEELKYWDGHQKPNRPKSFSYTSKEINNINTVSILATLTGKRAWCKLVIVAGRQYGRTFVCESDKAAVKFKGKKRYNGKVYCVNTDTGFFIIRRSGEISITSNSWRQMAGDKMSESVSKDTDGELFIPAKQCQKLINKYLEKNPEIEDIYFPWCRQQVMQGGICRNSWGRVFDVSGLRIDSDLYRKVYSFFPQAECADWTNQYGVIPGHFYMMARYGKPLNMQIHDEVVASVPIEEAYDCALFLKNAMEQRREIPAKSGRWLWVPAEVTVGLTLYGGVEFKKFPGTKGEFDKKVKEGLRL